MSSPDEIQCDQRTGNFWQDSLLARYTTIATVWIVVETLSLAQRQFV
jgi:hypothetical protein